MPALLALYVPWERQALRGNHRVATALLVGMQIKWVVPLAQNAKSVFIRAVLVLPNVMFALSANFKVSLAPTHATAVLLASSRTTTQVSLALIAL